MECNDICEVFAVEPVIARRLCANAVLSGLIPRFAATVGPGQGGRAGDGIAGFAMAGHCQARSPCPETRRTASHHAQAGD